MDWIILIVAFIGAIGLGGIIVKILDVWWLEKSIEKRDARKWVREQRLKAFTNLAKGILSFGLAKQYNEICSNPFEFYALAAEAMMLIDDKGLVTCIDQFIVSLDALSSGSITDQKQAEEKYYRLCEESRRIIDGLRQQLLSEINFKTTRCIKTKNLLWRNRNKSGKDKT